MNETEYNGFMKSYYSSEPDAERTAEAVRYGTSSSYLQQCKNAPGAVDINRFFLARIGIENSPVLRVYERISDDVSHEQRIFLLGILSCVGDATTKIFLQDRVNLDSYGEERVEIERILTSGVPDGLSEPLRSIVSTGLDLDFLWVEFFVSGNGTAIRRIIQVLEMPDRIRGELNGWLRSERSGLPRFFQWRYDRFARKLDESLGISVDISRKEVTTPEDLDCLCSMENLSASRERFKKARSILPFKLSAEQVNEIGVKASAKWSLGANSMSDDLVRSICKEEAETRDGRSKIALLEIVAAVYRSLGQHEEAAQYLQKYVRLHPMGMRHFAGL